MAHKECLECRLIYFTYFHKVISMDCLSYGHSSLCQESRTLVLGGQLTIALTVKNADKAHGLSVQESHSGHFFTHNG